jgi:UPF0716 family protein affecting phage T7 exclusion
MPIKPMDMQVLLPNIRRAARPENVKQMRQEMAAQQQQIKQDKDDKINKNKVATLKQKDDNAIKNDQKQREKNKKKKKKKDEDDNKDKKQALTDHPSHFDMKV